MIPAFSARSMASSFTSSISINFELSSSRRSLRASAIETLRFFDFLGSILPSISCKLIMDDSSIIPPPIMPTPPVLGCFTLMSIFRSSSSPFLIFSLKRSLVFSFSSASDLGVLSSSTPTFVVIDAGLIGGIRASRMILSTFSSAFSRTISFFMVLTRLTLCCTRSRTIDSTSRPT